jgi:serine/threonine protein kinase
MAAAPPTSDDFVGLVRKSSLIEPDRLDDYLEEQRTLGALPSEPKEIAKALIRDGFLTNYQAKLLLKGKYRGHTISKYKILERLGTSNNSSIFLCEHLSMRRKVALKILPLFKAEDPVALARFYREARAAGSLDHPNIVHTYDHGQEGNHHFLVMEYVDGSSLEQIVGQHGPMDISRASAYIRQAAIGLQHIHQAGLIHRDIKPGNILVERRGMVKILDLGLARFFHDHKDILTQQYNHAAILGTADYLSPEQALASYEVDTRTDIYSLGVTFYFLLAGRPPFEAKAITQKLLSHLTKDPPPLRELRPEIPEALRAVVEKMMAKDRDQRYQDAAAVVVALTPWTKTAIAPPPADEMPRLCSAAQSAGSVETGPAPADATSVPREPVEQRMHTLRTTFGRFVAKFLHPSCSEQPLSSGDLSIPALRTIPPPEQRQTADTASSICCIDTRSDLLRGCGSHRGSEQAAPAGPRRAKQLWMLPAACLVAAVVGGIALGVLSSKPWAASGAKKLDRGVIRPSASYPK